LLFFTVGLNFLGPQLASQPQAGFGGGGGDVETYATFAAEAAPATEAPAAEEPSIQLLPLPTATLSEEDSERIAETPAEKNGLADESAVGDAAQTQNVPPFVPSTWQVVLAGIVVIGASLMILMRQLAINRWRR
jgi:hypothetical protein